MTEEREHPVEFLPELALGVMPPANAEALQAHIAGCERCRGEYAELRRVAELLPMAAEDVSPPASLKAQVFERIAHEPVSLPGARAARRGWSWPPTALAAGVAAIALLAGAAGFLLGNDGDGSDSGGDRYALIARAAATGDLVRAAGSSDAASVAVIHAPGTDSVFAWVQGLPRLDRGKAYQAWFSRDGTTMEPGATFTENDGAVWLKTREALANYVLMAFTMEEEDGAAVPSQPPFVVIDLGAAAARQR